MKLCTEIRRRITTGRRGQSSKRVDPLNESGSEQRGTSSWSHLPSNNLEQDPGNCVRVDDGLGVRLCPHGARVLGILPRGADDATFSGVWTEEVSGQLSGIIVEQRGFRRKQSPVDSAKRLGRGAHVVLCANAVTNQERMVSCGHLYVDWYRRRCDGLGVSRVRLGDRESHPQGCDVILHLALLPLPSKSDDGCAAEIAGASTVHAQVCGLEERLTTHSSDTAVTQHPHDGLYSRSAENHGSRNDATAGQKRRTGH